MTQTFSSFFDLERSDLAALLQEHETSPVHVKALMAQAYRYHSSEPWAGDTLPKKLAGLNQVYPAKSLQIVKTLESGYDLSVKFLFDLGDGETIETVLMPEQSRITLCVSSQVGCRQACTFCHTGRMGLKRQMTAGEIVAQVVTANRWISEHPEWLAKCQQASGLGKSSVSNIVFMGMGEPLDNVPAIARAIRVLLDHYSLSLAAKRITVSTAGHLEGLREFMREDLGVSIALSLHAPSNRERSRLMPINRRFPIAEVLECLREYTLKTEEKIMVQYTLIAGVNDQESHALELAELLRGSLVKINLIPLNPIDPLRLQPPSPAQLELFAKILYDQGFQTLIRYSKGQDIAAACGQLVVS